MVEVTVRGLLVRFGEKVALDRIELRVEPGELFLLLGPSGSGKTTLLRVLAGFATPEQGTVCFGADDVTRLQPHRRNTGMVFQSFALFPHLSVSQNVAFGLRERKVGAAEIAERVGHALRSIGMADYGNRRVDQLSGGEQQRVAIARALVVRPRCLLLDEPLSNLDAKLRHSMSEEIRRVCKEFGLTTVYVTHDQKEALAIADRIAVMDAGRILQVGTPSDVYRRPANRTVAGFIGETNLFEGRIVEMNPVELRVSTPVGDLIAATPARPFASVGDRVWVSIRPECLAFIEDRHPSFAASSTTGGHPGSANAIGGTIVRSTYLGEVSGHQFSVNGSMLRIHELNLRSERPANEPLRAAVAASDVVILPYDGDHA